MRINILAGGLGGSVLDMQTDLSILHSNIEDTIEDLKDLKNKITRVNGGTHNLGVAIDGINNRIYSEETKKTKLETAAQKISTFLENTVYTDAAVARNVRQNQKDFFNDFPWMRPSEPDPEPSFWEKLADAWNDFWDTAGDIAENVINWVKENAVKLLIGVAAIVAGAVIAFLAGEAFLATLAALFVGAVIQGIIGGIISGLLSFFSGGSFWEGFGEGFADGFMWGGIFSMIGSAISAIRHAIKGLNVFDDVANIADDIVGTADDAANVVDDAAGVVDDAAGAADDAAGAADDAAGAVDDAANAHQSYPQTALDDLDNIDNFGDEAIEHIFQGQNKPHGASGYHYEGVDDVAGHIVDGTRTPVDKFGVYNAEVMVDGSGTTKLSSFFPRDWSPQKVVDKINQVFTKLNVPPGTSGKFIGYTDDGMEIAIVLRNGKIHTAFPIWQGP